MNSKKTESNNFYSRLVSRCSGTVIAIILALFLFPLSVVCTFAFAVNVEQVVQNPEPVIEAIENTPPTPAEEVAEEIVNPLYEYNGEVVVPLDKASEQGAGEEPQPATGSDELNIWKIVTFHYYFNIQCIDNDDTSSTLGTNVGFTFDNLNPDNVVISDYSQTLNSQTYQNYTIDYEVAEWCPSIVAAQYGIGDNPYHSIQVSLTGGASGGSGNNANGTTNEDEWLNNNPTNFKITPWVTDPEQYAFVNWQYVVDGTVYTIDDFMLQLQTSPLSLKDHSVTLQLKFQEVAQAEEQTGIITDSDENPIPNAQIGLYMNYYVDDNPDGTENWANLDTSVVTDEDGSYTIPIPEIDDDSLVQVWFKCDGYFDYSEWAKWGDIKAAPFANVHPRKMSDNVVTISGIVKARLGDDDQTAPYGGAYVMFTSAKDSSYVATKSCVGTMEAYDQTAEIGYFTLTIPAGEEGTLTGYSTEDGYDPASLQITHKMSQNNIVVNDTEDNFVINPSTSVRSVPLYFEVDSDRGSLKTPDVESCSQYMLMANVDQYGFKINEMNGLLTLESISVFGQDLDAELPTISHRANKGWKYWEWEIHDLQGNVVEYTPNAINYITKPLVFTLVLAPTATFTMSSDSSAHQNIDVYHYSSAKPEGEFRGSAETIENDVSLGASLRLLPDDNNVFEMYYSAGSDWDSTRFTANPASGYLFDGWYVDGVKLSGDTSILVDDTTKNYVIEPAYKKITSDDCQTKLHIVSDNPDLGGFTVNSSGGSSANTPVSGGDVSENGADIIDNMLSNSINKKSGTNTSYTDVSINYLNQIPLASFSSPDFEQLLFDFTQYSQSANVADVKLLLFREYGAALGAMSLLADNNMLPEELVGLVKDATVENDLDLGSVQDNEETNETINLNNEYFNFVVAPKAYEGGMFSHWSFDVAGVANDMSYSDFYKYYSSVKANGQFTYDLVNNVTVHAHFNQALVVSGKVVDQNNESTLIDPVICFYDDQDNFLDWAIPDSNGNFQATLPACDNYVIYAMSEFAYTTYIERTAQQMVEPLEITVDKFNQSQTVKIVGNTMAKDNESDVNNYSLGSTSVTYLTNDGQRFIWTSSTYLQNWSESWVVPYNQTSSTQDNEANIITINSKNGSFSMNIPKGSSGTLYFAHDGYSGKEFVISSEQSQNDIYINEIGTGGIAPTYVGDMIKLDQDHITVNFTVARDEEGNAFGALVQPNDDSNKVTDFQIPESLKLPVTYKIEEYTGLISIKDADGVSYTVKTEGVPGYKYYNWRLQNLIDGEPLPRVSEGQLDQSSVFVAEFLPCASYGMSCEDPHHVKFSMTTNTDDYEATFKFENEGIQDNVYKGSKLHVNNERKLVMSYTNPEDGYNEEFVTTAEGQEGYEVDQWFVNNQILDEGQEFIVDENVDSLSISCTYKETVTPGPEPGPTPPTPTPTPTPDPGPGADSSGNNTYVGGGTSTGDNIPLGLFILFSVVVTAGIVVAKKRIN